MRKTTMHFKDLLRIARDSGIAEVIRYDYRKTVGWETDVPVMKARMNLMGRNLTAQGLYDRFVNIVRDTGNEFFELEARKVAAYYGFSVEPIERVLPIGKRKRYEKGIESLRTRFEEGAVGGVSPEYQERELREIAAEYGFLTDSLDNVLKLRDPKKEAATHLAIGGLGFGGNTAMAEEIAKQHGFSLDELEEENDK